MQLRMTTFEIVCVVIVDVGVEIINHYCSLANASRMHLAMWISWMICSYT